MEKTIYIIQQILGGVTLASLLLVVHPSLGFSEKGKSKTEQNMQELKPVKHMKTIRKMGETTFKNQTLPNIQLLGNTHLQQVNVEGLTKIMGNTEIADSQLNKLQVYGNLTIQDCVIKGLMLAYGHTTCLNSTLQDHVKLFGYLTATNTTFQKNLQIASEEIIFEEVIAQDIYIHQIKTKKKVLDKKSAQEESPIQKLILKGKTCIQGSIIFESGKGILVLGPDAKVEGKVIGALIQK